MGAVMLVLRRLRTLVHVCFFCRTVLGVCWCWAEQGCCMAVVWLSGKQARPTSVEKQKASSPAQTARECRPCDGDQVTRYEMQQLRAGI